MKKLLTLLFVGMFLIGIVAAVSLGITEESFDKVLTKISTSKICQAEMLSNVRLCNPKIPSEIDIPNTLSIKTNKEGVIRIRNE